MNKAVSHLQDQSFFDMFNVDNTLEPHTLKTCAGVMETSGRGAHGFIVDSIDKKISLSLPTLIECSAIVNKREEIPTPEAAWHHQHLRPIAEQIPLLDPYAQKLHLGWVILVDVCLGNTHKPAELCVMKTHNLDNGCPRLFPHVTVTSVWRRHSASRIFLRPFPPR